MFRTVIVSVLTVALVGSAAFAGLLYWRWRQIPRVSFPKDPGVSVARVPVKPTSTVGAGSGTASDDTVPAETVATVPSGFDGAPGSVQWGVPGLPLENPNASSPDAATDFNPSVRDVAAAAANTVDPADLGPDGFLGTSKARNYLMVGVDDRSVVDDSQADAFGKDEVVGTRTDTIMLLRVDPSLRKAWVMSFPRDLLVDVPGEDRTDRINAIYAKGPGLLVEAIRENFGVPVDHLAVVNFAGFTKIVNALDGVGPICFAKPSRDTKSGLNQPPGCHILDAEQSVAFVRSRRLEQGENGTWKADPRGDLGRIQRQQTFIRAMLARARSRGMSNPVAVNRTLQGLGGALTIDNGLSLTEVIRLANNMRSFDPAKLKSFAVPVEPKRVDGKAVLVAAPNAGDILSLFGTRPVKNQA